MRTGRGTAFALAFAASACVAAIVAVFPARAQTPAPASAETSLPPPADIYEIAIRAFRAETYDDARKAFAELIRWYPESPFTRDAIYKTGETYYREEAWESAGGYYALYLQRYPLAVNAKDAKVRLRACEERAGRALDAVKPESRVEWKRLVAAWSDQWPFDDRDAQRRGLAAAAGAGANAVIVSAATRAGVGLHGTAAQSVVRQGLYFRSEAAPLVDDAVAEIAADARGYRMKVIAAISLRDAGWWTKRDDDWRDRVWNAPDRTVLAGQRLDLFSDEAVDALALAARDLAKAPVDGIVLRDAFILETEGLSDRALAAMTRATQLTYEPHEFFEASDAVGAPTLTEAYAKFARVKAERLEQVVRRIVEAARSANPSLPIFLELDPLSLIEPAEGLARRAQDLDTLIAVADGFVVFAPWRDLAPQRDLVEADRPNVCEAMSREAAARLNDPTRWIFALPVVEPATQRPYPAWEVDAAVAAARRAFDVGVALFPLRTDFSYNDRLRAAVAPAKSETP